MREKRTMFCLIALGVLAAFVLVLEIWVMAHAMANAGDTAPAGTEDSQADSSAVSDNSAGAESSILLFGGDLNLDDDGEPMTALAQTEGDISDCIDQSLVNMMNSAAVFCVNDEFAFTTESTPAEDKAKAFASDPENVSILQALGVDLVTLANDHIYDYGEQGLSDTLAALDGANISYVGAGADSAQAGEPVIFQIGEKKVAYVNANQIGERSLTTGMAMNPAGIFFCDTDTAELTQAIQSAKGQADYVVCCLHWGLEYNERQTTDQQTAARDCIDAGADVVVGTHPHCLQAIEYYQDKPIFYSLGSLWYSGKELDACLLALTVPQGKGELTPVLIPIVQKDCTTKAASGSKERAIFSQLEELSPGVTIGENGRVSQSEKEPEAAEGDQSAA